MAKKKLDYAEDNIEYEVRELQGCVGIVVILIVLGILTTLLLSY